MEFQECPKCAEKPGSPLLCHSCIHNRMVIEKLKQKIKEMEMNSKFSKPKDIGWTNDMCAFCYNQSHPLPFNVVKIDGAKYRYHKDCIKDVLLNPREYSTDKITLACDIMHKKIQEARCRELALERVNYYVDELDKL